MSNISYYPVHLTSHVTVELFTRVRDDHHIELAKHLHGYLGPFAEQGHDPTTEHHAGERIQ